MNTQASARVNETEQPRLERKVRLGLVLATFVFAFVVQSQFFAFTNTFRGDAAYHRGVAATMLNGHLQGEGPFSGLLSYYGGLYPMTLAAGTRILGVSFDGLLSVVSWFATLALPAALLLLGRRLWPERPIDQGVLVFVGTVGSSLALDTRAEWINSLLPSGANLWPLYPRDVAVVLMVVALGVAMGGKSLRRYAAVGLLGGVAIATQAQVGLLAVAAVAIWPFVQVGWQHRRDAFPRALLAIGVAASASAWWWAPRVVAVINDRPLLLQSYPKRPGLSIVTILGALGVTGVLALIGLVVMLRASSRNPSERFFLGWAIACAPLLVVSMFVGDAGVITARRAWFLMGVPLVVLAARGGTMLLRALPLMLGIAILVLALAMPATIEALDARRAVDARWVDHARGWEPFSDRLWSSALATLTHKARDDPALRVLVPDNDAAYVWSRTGAQPFSLFPESGTKLGFDPGKATGISYLARVHREQQAFSDGLTALCGLARSDRSDVLVLRGAEGLVAVRDIRRSAQWRVAPQDRSLRTIERRVAPGVWYRDRNDTEDLLLSPGASIPVGFSGAGIRALEVQIQDAGGSNDPPVELQLPGGATTLRSRTERDGATVASHFSTPHGLPPGARIVARKLTAITRVMGYEALRAAHIAAPNGTKARPVVLATTDVCGRRSTGKR